MSEIKVSFGALETASKDVADTAVQMNGELDNLKRYLAPMVATWGGGASTEYSLMQRKWDTAAVAMTDVLRRIGVALADAKAGYMQAETVNKNRW